MHCCNKYVGGVILALGVLFLLRDLNVWNFWNISWWTVAFLVAGGAHLWSSCCTAPLNKTNGKKK
ncbi:MAG: hypothetical protein KKG75_04235 [Nanoarchaeota archaeon]|nr:hypothetical protein [Nanoarchaeota archaeon]